MATARDIDDLLPLSPAAFHILVALADGEKHGYAILKDVRRRADVKLSPGTLYAVINRLLEDDLIEESDQRPDAALDDERRHYYRLTSFGRDVAIAEARRMESALALARASKLVPRAARRLS